MNVTFRKATEEDALVISTLADKIWNAHYPTIISAAQINYMLSTRYAPEVIAKSMANGEQYFVALLNDLPIAYASVQAQQHGYCLHKFYVDVEEHRKGIGQKMLDYLLTQIDALKPIRLQVNRTNIKAINFYFRNGFTIEQVGDFDIGGGYFMNDFVMVRKP